MSNDLVEGIPSRLREEIERLGLSMAAASRAAGESSPQRIKDVMGGKQKCPIDLLARLGGIGVDLIYVLMAERWSSGQSSKPSLAPDEELMLETYRGLVPAKKKQLLASLLTGDVGKKPAKSGGISVSGSRNRTAGRDYHEKE
ncbi:hypothetical protein D9M68_325430 [compost metagenome]